MKHYLRMAGLVALLLAILTTPLLAQDMGNQDQPGPWLPPSASDYAPRIDFLYTFIFWLTTGMFLLTEGLLIVFCIIYRRRPAMGVGVIMAWPRWR